MCYYACMSINRITKTFSLTPQTYERLRKMAFISRKSSSSLVEEGLQLLFQTAPKGVSK